MARRVCNFLQLSCVFYSEQVYMLYYLNNIRHLKHKTLKYNSTEVIFPFCHMDKKKSNISKSLSKPLPSLVKLINQLKNFTEKQKILIKIYQIVNTGILDTFKISQKKLKGGKSLSLLLLNICSLSKNFDNFCILLQEINMNFDITALTELRIKKDSVSPINTELENYSIEHTPTEIAAGGALLYFNKRLSYSRNVCCYHVTCIRVSE